MNIPPILVDDSKIKPLPVQLNNYFIGSINDPHWKPYPKNDYPSIRFRLPITYAITDYVWDNDNYALYMPGEDSLSKIYSIKLRDHYESLHKYFLTITKEKEKQENEEKIKKDEENIMYVKEKIKQLTYLLNQEKKMLSSLEKEFSVYKNAANRYIRLAMRQGATQKNAEESFLNSLEYNKRIRVLQIENTINTIKVNINSMKSEINEFKKMTN